MFITKLSVISVAKEVPVPCQTRYESSTTKKSVKVSQICNYKSVVLLVI